MELRSRGVQILRGNAVFMFSAFELSNLYSSVLAQDEIQARGRLSLPEISGEKAIAQGDGASWNGGASLRRRRPGRGNAAPIVRLRPPRDCCTAASRNEEM